MNRRDVLLAMCAIAVATPARHARGQAQVARRIGVLSPSGPPLRPVLQQSLRDALQKIGYREGVNLSIEWRFADAKVERLPALAEELVRQGVELIVAHANPAIEAAKRATNSIPIVMYTATTPVEMGFVQSLAHPGGNITGTTYSSPEMAGKVLEVLKETVPHLKRVAVLWNPTFPGMRIYAAEAEIAARVYGVSFEYFDVQHAPEIVGALERISNSRPDALYVVGDPIVSSALPAIAALAMERKLVSAGTTPGYLAAGGLFYYGPDVMKITSRTAAYVDRILRGAKPADLAVEQPTNFELTVNMKTARALGIQVPRSILVRANQVVD
jgi:ABC-type uncharacterized transport system substrate-binding protein